MEAISAGLVEGVSGVAFDGLAGQWVQKGRQSEDVEPECLFSGGDGTDYRVGHTFLGDRLSIHIQGRDRRIVGVG